VGTNHYHWFTSIRHNGKDVCPEVLKRLDEAPAPEEGNMSKMLCRIYGHQLAIMGDSHIIEFYPFLAQAEGGTLPYGLKPWLGQEGYKTPLDAPEPTAEERQTQRQAHLKEFAEGLEKVTLPDAPSDPLTGEGLGRMVESFALGRRDVYIVNIENRGTVPNLPAFANLETEGVTCSQGFRPVYMGEAPLSLMGFLTKRIAWQELVADAAVKGDRNLALQALLLDEMAIPPERAEAMLDELLAASKPMLPRFFG
jgi:alpha-galactosidase